MGEDIQYGKMTKRIVFVDSDHRHAQLILKLKNDNISQSDFFRAIVTGYIENDERVGSYIEDIAKTSKRRKEKSRQLRKLGTHKHKSLGLSPEDVGDIFDIIAEEHPEL